MQTGRRKQIVIVGAGYAGVLAANRLAGRADHYARIILVNERDELVHRVRLHEVLAGRPRRVHPLSALVHPRVERVRARVVRIDADVRCCVFEDPEQPPLAYDQLVYAVGSTISRGIPGAREHAMALGGPEQAERFAERLRRLPEGAPVVVVGTGLSGIEVASEIAEAFPGLRVTLLGDELAPGWPDPLRAHAREELDVLRVRVLEGARASAITAERVELDDGRQIASSATLWATGFSASGLARESGLRVDALGRLLVDETLRVPEHPEIVGCGDAVAAPLGCGGTGAVPLRMACATAMPMGAHAADVVAAALGNMAPLPFRYKNTVQCVSLGRRRGLLVFIDQDDQPTGKVLVGVAGALAKELICRLVIGALRLERRVPGAFVWHGRRSRAPGELGSGRATHLLDRGDNLAP